MPAVFTHEVIEDFRRQVDGLEPAVQGDLTLALVVEKANLKPDQVKQILGVSVALPSIRDSLTKTAVLLQGFRIGRLASKSLTTAE